MAYSLKDINEAVRSDPKGYSESCDAEFQRKVQATAEKIAENRDTSHVILLTGPSGSGKTTTAIKIGEALQSMGIRIRTVSMDSYFNTIDPETAPRNREGSIDYESPFCLDYELLSRHFAMLDQGDTIHIPKYELSRQMRSDILSQPMRLGRDDMVVFEGIHALNDLITSRYPKAFKLYIAARSNVEDEGQVVFQHPWLRLCRRIARDFQIRGGSAEFTMKMWANVSRMEKLYISPYKENADVLLDSSLPCECSVLKPYVVPLLEAMPRNRYPEADQILAAYEHIEGMADTFLAADSLAREFVGGSTCVD